MSGASAFQQFPELNEDVLQETAAALPVQLPAEPAMVAAHDFWSKAKNDDPSIVALKFDQLLKSIRGRPPLPSSQIRVHRDHRKPANLHLAGQHVIEMWDTTLMLSQLMGTSLNCLAIITTPAPGVPVSKIKSDFTHELGQVIKRTGAPFYWLSTYRLSEENRLTATVGLSIPTQRLGDAASWTADAFAKRRGESIDFRHWTDVTDLQRSHRQLVILRHLCATIDPSARVKTRSGQWATLTSLLHISAVIGGAISGRRWSASSLYGRHTQRGAETSGLWRPLRSGEFDDLGRGTEFKLHLALSGKSAG